MSGVFDPATQRDQPVANRRWALPSVAGNAAEATARAPRLVLLVNESKHFLSHRLGAAQAAVQAGFEVHLITRLLNDRAAIERHGIRVHPIEFPRTVASPLVELRTVRRLQQLYDALQPDLLHHFSAKAVLLGSLAARRVQAQHVVNTFTGLGAAFTSDGLRARARRAVACGCLKYLLRPAHWQVTFQNYEDMRQLIDARLVRPDRCEVIAGSGVDPEMFRPVAPPAGEPIVMLASRMIWPKGIAEFVAAATLLKQTATKARFVLVGETDSGSTTAVAAEQLQRWHRDGVIEWWGYRSDMAATLNSATVVGLPTFYGEGLPKVLLEAAACARPLIATDIRGCREIVHDNQNGWLVPPRDVDSLASSIWRMLHLPPARRNQMGRRGRELVMDQFTSAQVNDRTLAIYRRMLGMPCAASAGQTPPRTMHAA